MNKLRKSGFFFEGARCQLSKLKTNDPKPEDLNYLRIQFAFSFLVLPIDKMRNKPGPIVNLDFTVLENKSSRIMIGKSMEFFFLNHWSNK